ncbi:uncharacterized protein LOC142239667 [Haematobia irritans]|uniref:uncharacterized protein LOC142239667 n=1 Tax=Haematobia irritans TaxID=7368 RepID=UPI003F4F6D8F
MSFDECYDVGKNDSSSTGGIRVKMLQREQILARFESASHNLESFDCLGLHQLEVKLSIFERQWDTFETLQRQLEALDESQFSFNHHSVCEEAYFIVKSKLLEKIAVLKQGTPDNLLCSTHVMQPTFSNQTSKVNLPTLQLTKFNGQHRDWLDFFNTFRTLVHDNPDLSSITKFQYLRSCLTDSAARLIQSLEVTESNYFKAIDILTNRYDNKIEIFHSHIRHIFDMHKVKQSCVSSLRDLIDTINADLRALESIASKSQIADGILLHMVVSKLDVETQAKWEEETSTMLVRAATSANLQLPSWDNLSSFLERRCKILSIVNSSQTGHSHSQRSTTATFSRNVSSFVVSNQQSICVICNSTPYHGAFHCPVFMEANAQDRFTLAKKHKLCLNCLGMNHVMSSCPSQNRCRQCNASHNTLLHRDPPTTLFSNQGESEHRTPQGIQNSEFIANETMQTVSLKIAKENSLVILATAIVELCNENGVKIRGRALLDSCSQLNFITKRVAQLLKPSLRKVNIEVSGLGNSSVSASQACSITVKSLVNDFAVPLDVVVIPCISSYHPQSHIDTSGWHVPENITLADKNFHQPGEIDLLIGADLFWDLLMVGRIKVDNQPNLIKTKLGWVVTGSIVPADVLPSKSMMTSNKLQSTNLLTSYISSYTSCNPTMLQSQITLPPPNNDCSQHFSRIPVQDKYKLFSSSNEPILEMLLQRFWTLEECGETNKKIMSAEETMCEQLFCTSTKRCPKTNKFIVRLPFKTNPSTLGQSFDIARRRLYYIEQKLMKSNQMRKDYTEFMNEYHTLGHMSPLPAIDVAHCNFIPHHGVLKLDSSTTRLRVVFDASCATSNGKSLNDVLCVGPQLQDDIFSMLSRFRYHKYVMVADIAKMYRQVLVDPADAQWQCTLWRDTSSNLLTTYRLNTLTYGTSCAPYLAVKCLQKLAQDYSTLFPIGAAVTMRDFYVDNLMTGGESIMDLIEIKTQVIKLLQLGGFPLRKFAANVDAVLADVPDEDKETIVHIDNMNFVKTLGLRWAPDNDSLGFSYAPHNQSNKLSKRIILAHTSAFFDPLGLINPMIVRAKILLQSLWKLNLHWDESVPQDIFEEFHHIRMQLSNLKQLKIARFVPFNSTTNIHAFADASQKAYGACIYVVSQGANGVESSLICAKSKVAPMKEVTLPKLELCAALLCIKLLQSARKSFPKSPNQIYCWSDSSITLSWITGAPSKWPIFVANRVSQIQQLSEGVQWRHVPTDLNPADLLSRGCTLSTLLEREFWFKGPPFICMEMSEWPKQIKPIVEDTSKLEDKQYSFVVSVQEDILQTHKFINNYQKLLRILAYVNRFLSNTRYKKN